MERKNMISNKNGLLTKSVTRYNDTDYDVTYYKYAEGERSIEKRSETYRDNKFDPSTSIANFYEKIRYPTEELRRRSFLMKRNF